MGIVINTVGLVVGTGRGGMTLPGLAAVGSRVGAANAVGVADALVAVLRSARGPLLSQAADSARAASNGPRIMRAILIRQGVVRKLFIALACMTTLGRIARAQEDAGTMRAEMRCERVDAPGRVRCEVDARVAPGESIAAGDVVIVRTPPFVTALRGRIGPHDATTREADIWRWALGLAAREKGIGIVEARVRLVVCRGATCAPREAPIAARVVVGD
jgi:hypothetical protein